jgi:hypothetical protein
MKLAEEGVQGKRQYLRSLGKSSLLSMLDLEMVLNRYRCLLQSLESLGKFLENSLSLMVLLLLI